MDSVQYKHSDMSFVPTDECNGQKTTDKKIKLTGYIQGCVQKFPD
jgi:hypothetical protein